MAIAWLVLAPPVAIPQQAVERVVSLVPAATEVLFAIGAGDRVVGVSSFDRWPQEVELLQRVGALLDPDLEAILALRPDLVVADPSLTSLAERLAAAEIRVYAYATAGIEDVAQHMQSLGAAVGMAAEGRQAAARLRADLQGIRAAHTDAPHPDVMLVFGRRTGSFAEVWVNGGIGFLHELIEIAGGHNLYGDVQRPSLKAGLETLLVRVPDIVIEVRVGAPASERAALEREWRALPGFGAVEVALITEYWLLVPGPRMVEAARGLGEILRPRD